MSAPRKPQGRKGAIHLSERGAEWAVINFPSEKRARELMVAEMFMRGANKVIVHESDKQPKYPPFKDLTQNDENDLDFTITTSGGERKLMELAEFAPLDNHGPQFKDAPLRIQPAPKADQLRELVRKKSDHQGGTNRMLLIYVTEHSFAVDPPTIEIVRRALDRAPPKFERIYYVSPNNEVDGGVWEIFPGQPHSFYEKMSDQQLSSSTHLPHPTELIKK